MTSLEMDNTVFFMLLNLRKLGIIDTHDQLEHIYFMLFRYWKDKIVIPRIVR